MGKSTKFKPMSKSGPVVLNRKVADEIILHLDKIKTVFKEDKIIGAIIMAMMEPRNKDGNTKTEVALNWHRANQKK